MTSWCEGCLADKLVILTVSLKLSSKNRLLEVKDRSELTLRVRVAQLSFTFVGGVH